MMLIDTEFLTHQLHIFFYGFFDSLSFHSTLPVLVNNAKARGTTFSILGCNGTLIIGSYFLYTHVIQPMLALYYSENFTVNDNQQYNSLLYFLYQTLWMLPMCILCYVASLSWLV